MRSPIRLLGYRLVASCCPCHKYAGRWLCCQIGTIRWSRSGSMNGYGVIDGTTFFPTTEGIPQGGPLSPLLANIALHGLETAIQTAFPKEKRYNDSRQCWKPTVIRYADDFVALHQDRAVIEQCQDIANEWLADMGLRLKPSKTQIAHTLQHENDTAGFTFLGFHIRHYRVGKTHTSKSGGPGRPTTLLGFTTNIKPSTEALKRHSKHLKDIIRTARAWSQDAL